MGSPPGPHAASLLCHSEEVLVRVSQPPHAPNSCPQPILGNWSQRPCSFVHAPFSIGTASPHVHCTMFLFINLCPPQPLTWDWYLIWLRGGFSVFVLRWSVGVFQEMVILYDFSWNLF